MAKHVARNVAWTEEARIAHRSAHGGFEPERHVAHVAGGYILEVTALKNGMWEPAMTFGTSRRAVMPACPTLTAAKRAAEEVWEETYSTFDDVTLAEHANHDLSHEELLDMLRKEGGRRSRSKGDGGVPDVKNVITTPKEDEIRMRILAAQIAAEQNESMV